MADVIGLPPRWCAKHNLTSIFHTWLYPFFRHLPGDGIYIFEQGCNSLTHSPTHPHTPNHPLTHSPTHPPTHPPTHARTHSLTHSFLPSLLPSSNARLDLNSRCSVPHGPNHTARYDAVGHAWIRTLFPYRPALDAVGHTWTGTPYHELHCGSHRGPNTCQRECQIERIAARQNARIDAKNNVRIDARQTAR